MSKKIAVFLANGFEEVEALATVDVLRRAGLDVVTAAAGGAKTFQVVGAHNIPVTADCFAKDLNASDLILTICPGGLPGATNLRDDPVVTKLIATVFNADNYAAAICAAPIVLNAAGLLNGRKYTCYPSFEKQINPANYTGSRVQVDGKIITACGPGASLEFAYEILRQLGMGDVASKIKDGLLAK